MRELRQGTQVIVLVGPFVSNGAHDVPDAAVVLGDADDAELVKHGGGSIVDISGRPFSQILGGSGQYNLTLTAGDTNTPGMLRVFFREQGKFQLLSHDFMVKPANVYDSMFGVDKLDVSLVEVLGDSAAAANVKADYDGNGFTKTNSAIGAVGAVAVITGNVDGSVGSILGVGVKKNTALANFTFPMLSSADKTTPITERVVAAVRSIDGAPAADAANSVTEAGSGLYVLDIAAADLDGDTITFLFTAPGAALTVITFVPFA